MKTIRISFLYASLLVLILSCGKDSPAPASPSEAELRTAILTGGTGTWTPSAANPITVEDLPIPELFENFTIKFTATGYTTTGTTPVWKRSGTWRFKDDTGTVILLDSGADALEVAVTDITASSLKLTLEWDQTTYDEGRTKSLTGTHVFTLSK